MIREDAKLLLQNIRKLSLRDPAVQTFLKLAEVEAKATVENINASQDYIDDYIINRSLGKLATDIILFQTSRVHALMNDIAVLENNKER